MLREVVLQVHGQLQHVARRRFLLAVGQTGRVLEDRRCHSKLAGSFGHEAGEVFLAAPNVLGQGDSDIVCRFGDKRLDCVKHNELIARFQLEL